MNYPAAHARGSSLDITSPAFTTYPYKAILFTFVILEGSRAYYPSLDFS